MGALSQGVEVVRDGTVNGVEKKVRCVRFTAFDGTVVDIPMPPEDAPESVKRQWTPFTFIRPDDRLPEQGYPVTVAAKMAKQACPDGNYAWFAEDLGVPVETVERWVKDGLDWRKQSFGRDRVPIRPGDMWGKPGPGGGIRLMAIHKQPVGRSVAWMPDWNQGELLDGIITETWLPEDHPMRKAQRSNFDDNRPFFKRGIRELSGSWKGKPVILAGCGPSIAWQADEIRAAAKLDVKVLSCNAGMKYLGPEAIDYYLLMDWMARDRWFDGIDCKQTELISMTVASALSRGYWPEDRTRFFCSNMSKAWLPEDDEYRKTLGFLIESQAVSVSMLFFAYYVLQANPIILAGFDLCFPGLMEYPDQRLNYSDRSIYRFTDEFPSGRLAVTAEHLLNQRSAIDLGAIFARKAGTRVLNCSPVSILRNRDVMDLGQAIRRFVVEREDPTADEHFRAIRDYESVMLGKEGRIN